jgi:hypothetical protein
MPDDARSIWQSQPSQPAFPSSEEIRRRAEALQSKNRWSALTWIVTGLALSVWFGRYVVVTQPTMARIGYGILALWGLYGAFHAYKWIWPRAVAPAGPVDATRDFYRRELERKRDYARNIWWRSGLPIGFMGVAFLLVPPLIKVMDRPLMLLNAAPFFALLGIWIVLFIVFKRRSDRQLQRELDELNAGERKVER